MVFGGAPLGHPLLSALVVLIVVVGTALVGSALWRVGLASIFAAGQKGLSWLDARITLNLTYVVGTRLRTRWLRWTNLLVYFALVLAGIAFTPTASAILIALVLGFGGVWAVFEHWSWDEAERFANVPRELKQIPTQESLIAEMLVAIACVPTIATVALQRLQDQFSIYELAPGSGTFAFARLTLGELVKAIPLVDYYEIYEPLLRFENVVGVTAANVWGMTATFALRVAYDVITIAGLIKLVEIRRRISGGEDLREIDTSLRSPNLATQLSTIAKLRGFALRGAAAARRRLGDVVVQRIERVPFRFGTAVRYEAADALREVGATRIDRGALLESIRALRSLAVEVDRGTAEEFWARIQDTLGVALRILGEFLQGRDAISTLQESIGAFEAALEIRTRKAYPEQWARTQNNFGISLTTLGERLSGDQAIAHLRRSELVFREALEVFTRETHALDWAKTQSNLGIALSSLSERLEEGDERIQTLRNAIDAFESSLSVLTTADLAPLRGLALSGKATTQRILAERLPDTEAIPMLRDSISAFRDSLRLRPLSESPITWAIAQNGLGNAYRVLGSRLPGAKGRSELRQAIRCYQAAQLVYLPDEFPLQWAFTEANLGSTYLALAGKLRGKAALAAVRQAITHLRAALDVFESGAETHYANQTRELLHTAKQLLAALT